MNEYRLALQLQLHLWLQSRLRLRFWLHSRLRLRSQLFSKGPRNYRMTCIREWNCNCFAIAIAIAIAFAIATTFAIVIAMQLHSRTWLQSIAIAFVKWQTESKQWMNVVRIHSRPITNEEQNLQITHHSTVILDCIRHSFAIIDCAALLWHSIQECKWKDWILNLDFNLL